MLMAGKPTLIVPIVLEQGLMARRVRQFGAGLDASSKRPGMLVERLGRLLDDPRFATGKARLEHAPECVVVIDEIFATRTLDEWRVTLAGLTTPWMVVQTAAEASHDPQVEANGFVVDVEGATTTFPLVASPVQVDGAPPMLTRAPDHGEQTEEVLLELGRTWDEIAALKASGAVL
jgi:crotonobetainyl-CoA:carnitine CoA-transferase CaiB-like acyl-CoA transferase